MVITNLMNSRLALKHYEQNRDYKETHTTSLIINIKLQINVYK